MLRERLATFFMVRRQPGVRQSTQVSSDQASYFSGVPSAGTKDNSTSKGSHSGINPSHTLLGSGSTSKLPKPMLQGFAYPQAKVEPRGISPAHAPLAGSNPTEQRHIPPLQPPGQPWPQHHGQDTSAPIHTFIDNNINGTVPMSRPAPSHGVVISKFHEDLSNLVHKPPTNTIYHHDTGHRLSLVREDSTSRSSHRPSTALSRLEEIVQKPPDTGRQDHGGSQSRSGTSEEHSNGVVGSVSSNQSSVRNDRNGDEARDVVETHATFIDRHPAFLNSTGSTNPFLRSGTASQSTVEDGSRSNSEHEYFRNAGPLIRPPPPVSYNDGTQVCADKRPISFHLADSRPYTRGGTRPPTIGANGDGAGGHGLAHVDGIGDPMVPMI